MHSQLLLQLVRSLSMRCVFFYFWLLNFFFFIVATVVETHKRRHQTWVASGYHGNPEKHGDKPFRPASPRCKHQESPFTAG